MATQGIYDKLAALNNRLTKAVDKLLEAGYVERADSAWTNGRRRIRQIIDSMYLEQRSKCAGERSNPCPNSQ